jgi:hypothetical protein
LNFITSFTISQYFKFTSVMTIPPIPPHLLSHFESNRSFNGLNREACTTLITQLLSLDASFIANTAFFKNNSIPSSYQLTLPGCKAICGPQRYIHPDAGAIINAWMLPILTVFAQVNLRNRKALIDGPHLMGDVLDWFWCLIWQLEGAKKAARAARRAWIARREESGVRVGEVVEADFQGLELNGLGQEGQVQRQKEDTSSREEALVLSEDDWIIAQGTVNMYLGALRGNAGNNGCQHDFWMKVIRISRRETPANHENSSVSSQVSSILSVNRQDRLMVDFAQALSNGRTYSIGNTILALLLWGFQVISSFSVVIGGSPHTLPGARIGLSMTLHFVVPAVLITNFMGSFPSETFCEEQLYRIAYFHGCNFRTALEEIRQSDAEENKTKYYPGTRLASLLALDATGVYRRSPRFPHQRGPKSTYRSPFLLFLAASPILISITFALANLWYIPPKGITTRFLIVLSIFLIYTTSAFLTALLQHITLSARIHVLILSLKDIFCALAVLSLLLTATIGVWNNCDGWAPYWNRFVVLDRQHLETNWKRVYPAIFALDILFLLLVTGGMYYAVGKEGIKLLRWSGERRDRMFKLLYP